ncbi:MAG: hypothetical protein D6795_01345 [Deltaproteobacteria bacterium]|nr:MAG: hypothetical protein D6795_01345 [Deltaproteobacteria bacterium]
MTTPPTRNQSNFGAIGQLEGYIDRLWKTFVWVVFLIILLPVFLYGYFEQAHTSRRTKELARLFLVVTECQKRLGREGEAWLSTWAREEMEARGIHFLEIEREGERLLHIGEEKSVWYFPKVVEAGDPMGKNHIRLQLAPTVTWGEIYRIIGIHLVVASFFVLLGYLLPIRALRTAVADVKLAQTLVIHSGQLSAIGEIYSVLMHEINNPLGILLNRVELVKVALEQEAPHTDLACDIEVIERHARRISEILKGTLIFSRKSSAQWEAVDLCALARELLSLLKAPFQKDGISCRIELPGTPVVVMGNPNHLRQVLLNLVNNARDAMPDGGELTLRVLASDGRAVIEVKDTGIGFGQDVSGKLFQPFFTTKPEGKGTGLGLAISHSIVADHGGCIEAESAPGRGSSFRIRLPLKEESHDAGSEGGKDPGSGR